MAVASAKSCGNPKIDELVAKAQVAAKAFKNYTQEQVDKITAAMDAACVANEKILAEEAVAETGIGRADHKAIKNHLGGHVVYEYFKNKKSVGVIREENGIKYIAEPFGVIAAATPTTNPPSTVFFKSLIALKSRNVIIFAFHPRAQKVCTHAAQLMLDAAVKAGRSGELRPVDRRALHRRHQPADEAPRRAAHPGHRRRRHGEVGVQLRSPGHRRRPRQRPGLRLQVGQPQRCHQQHHRLQDLRQRHHLRFRPSRDLRRRGNLQEGRQDVGRPRRLSGQRRRESQAREGYVRQRAWRSRRGHRWQVSAIHRETGRL